jgi:hypothetical protein
VAGASECQVDELAHRLARLTAEDVETAVERTLSRRLSHMAFPPPKARRAALQRVF